MIFGFLFQIVFIILIVLGVRKLRSGSSKQGLHGETIRRFFQYLLLYGLVIVVANGFSGLLARWIESSDVLVTDQTALARNVSFVVVGLPLYVGIALWTRRQYLDDRKESKSFGWSLYFTLASMTFLIGSTLALREVLLWVVGLKSYESAQLAQFVIWGILWAAHWWIDRRLTPAHNARAHNIAGSLYGLVFLVVGLVELLSGALERVLNLGGDSLFIAQKDSLREGAITAAVGLAVWILYWLVTSLKLARDPLWLAYVMLVGAGGGLVMAVVSLSTVLYSSLVWLVGTPTSQDAAEHFKSFPLAAAATTVGASLWWYHRAVLQEAGGAIRSEVRRVYEYLMSAIGLIASAIGFAIVLVALVDVLTESTRVAGGGSRNTLLAAVTLLVVGSPVWWIYWSRIQRFVRKDPVGEHASPTRRVYLFVLFGIGGLTAVVTLLVGVFFLFDDIFKGNFGEETIRRIRIPLGLLLSTGGVAGYHWLVYRSERDQYQTALPHHRFAILVGVHDVEMVREIGEKTGVRIQAWSRSDGFNPDWTTESIVRAIQSCKEESMLILSTEKGPEVIPIDK